VRRLERVIVAAFLAALEQASHRLEQSLLILLLIAHDHRIRQLSDFPQNRTITSTPPIHKWLARPRSNALSS
jgi:hypothetical protein